MKTQFQEGNLQPPKEPQPSQGAGAEEALLEEAKRAAMGCNCGPKPQPDAHAALYLLGHAAGRASQDARIKQLEQRELFLDSAENDAIARAEAAEKERDRLRSSLAVATGHLERCLPPCKCETGIGQCERCRVLESSLAAMGKVGGTQEEKK